MTEYFSLEGGKVFKLRREDFMELTCRQVIDGPYVVKTSNPTIRYVGNDTAYIACEKKGDTEFLFTLISRIGTELGFGSEMLDFKVGRVIDALVLKTAKDVFPGSITTGGSHG